MNHPSQITPCINLFELIYDKNIVVYPVITRFINRNKLTNNKFNDPIFTDETKRLLLEYMGYQEQNSLLFLSFAELFGIILQVIENHPDSSSIKEILNQKMNDSICKCFTGRMNRLVNVLNGFDKRVIIKIADSDSIANVIIMLKKKYTNLTELKEAVHKELIERGYEETVIKDWIDFIE